MQVPVVQQILKANDQVALENEKTFRANGVRVVNVMASPGAGKTSLILQVLERLRSLPEQLGAGVIEGDIASSIDADLIAAHGVPVVQINTGGNCHLDAPMIRSALEHLPLDSIDLLFIENVGNLICPANYRLGADLNLVIASVPEGHDKPYKYPGMFASADLVVLNKYDLADVFEFDDAAFERGVRMVNPTAPIHRVSARTGDGVQAWLSELLQQLALQPA
ncbi:MAG TPA: hydrogenase nickel incorporation protein HypB [Longimicrobiales bacterium]|nr:hydrogenase nickel incorporation protein HypB [Longimicrobiales bacterium]